jgi:hypothetical protein
MGVENIAAGTTANFFATCTPAIRTSIETDGIMTMTNVQRPLPSELESIFTSGSSNYYWRNMQDLWAWRFSVMPLTYGKVGLFDFLADNAVDVSGKLTVPEAKDGRLEIAPFVWARREEPITNETWNAASGFRSDVAGDASAAGSYWTVTVSSPTNIPLAEGTNESKWFPVGMKIYARTLTQGNVVADTAWTVAAYISASNKLVLSPAMPTTGSGFGRGAFDWGVANTLLAPPITGTLRRGAVTKNPYESYCEQDPGLISNQEDPFWFGWATTTFNQTESWLKLQAMLAKGNPLFNEFYSLPEARLREQHAKSWKKMLAHMMMYNTPASVYQTTAAYRSLDKVTFYYPPTISASAGTVAAGSSEYISYVADPVGIMEQHHARGRVVNAQNQPFNIPRFETALYGLTRYRDSIGMPNAKIVELHMPQLLYPSFDAAMLQRIKYQSQDMLQMNVDVSRKQNRSPMGFSYREYELQYPADTILRVVFHEFFDDELARQTAVGNAAAGRQIWCVPWKYNRMGIVNSIRTVRELGDIEKLAAVNPDYECKQLSRKYWRERTSVCFTVLCQAPMAGLIFEGLGDTVEGINQGSSPYPDVESGCSQIP